MGDPLLVILSRVRHLAALAGLTALAFSPLHGQGPRDTVDVLFLGNSYVYYNNLPAMLEGVSVALEGPILRSAARAPGGQTLRGHISDGLLPGMLANGPAAGGEWEWVVLQEQSTLGTEYDQDRGLLGTPDAFHSAARELVDMVRHAGVAPALYMTWAKERFPTQSEPLSRAYLSIGTELAVEVARVGEAWERARQLRPELGLYIDDGSHPNAAGSYLAACVFYALFTGRSPIGAPGEILGAPWESNRSEGAEPDTVLVSLSEADAHFLQEIAAETAGVGGRNQDP